MPNRRHTRTRVACTCLAATLGAGGCSAPNPLDETDCTRELRVALSPRDTAIVVGESFTPRLALSSCGGREQLTDSSTWAAGDPAVVSVEAATGRITGLTPGATAVEVAGDRYGRLGTVHVVVRPAP